MAGVRNTRATLSKRPVLSDCRFAIAEQQRDTAGLKAHAQFARRARLSAPAATPAPRAKRE